MFNFLFMRFAVFNLADIFIVVAGITLCLHVIFYRGDGSEEGEPAPKKARKSRAAAPGQPLTRPRRTSCICPHGNSSPSCAQSERRPAAARRPGPPRRRTTRSRRGIARPLQAQPVTPAAPSAPKKAPAAPAAPEPVPETPKAAAPAAQTGGHSPRTTRPARLSQQHARRAGRTGSRGQRQGKRHRPGGRRALFARRHFSGVFGFLMEQRTIQTQESAERIDALLARSLPELTRSAAQRLLAQGAVTKDGAPVKKNYKTAAGRHVCRARCRTPRPRSW